MWLLNVKNNISLYKQIKFKKNLKNVYLLLSCLNSVCLVYFLYDVCKIQMNVFFNKSYFE